MTILRWALPVLALWLGVLQSCAQAANCDLDIESLRNSPAFSTLEPHDQKLVLQTLRDDIAEMAEVDEASSGKHYRDYFASHLKFKEITGGAPDGKLLLLRYDSNTICGGNDNCPVWVIELANGKAESLIGWRPGFGTSAEGSWGMATPIDRPPAFPELIFLTHLSRYQTGAHCYRKVGKLYEKVECTPACAEVIKNLRKPPGASEHDVH